MLNLFRKTNNIVLIDWASAYACQKSFQDNDIDSDIDHDREGLTPIQIF